MSRDGYRHELTSKYGIDPAVHFRLYVLQNGVCFICKNEEHSKERLCVDHDHETGEVRALLCARCNSAIGFLKEDAKALKRARKYINRKEWLHLHKEMWSVS